MKRITTALMICSITLLFSACDSNRTIDTTKSYTEEVTEDLLIPIEECREEYQNAITNSSFSHLIFEDAEFESFPCCEYVGIYEIEHEEISARESLDIITNWLNENNLSVDLDKELFAVTEQFDGDNPDGDDPHGWYPLVMPHIDELENGNGFFINTDSCHIQMGNANVYSMSTGVISSYVFSNVDDANGYYSSHLAFYDAVGGYFEELVVEGTVEELKDESYQLLNGPMTIGEAANNVKEYFENGTPYISPSGLEMDVPYVRVYTIGDIYGYEFYVRRVYCGVPFVYGDYGECRNDPVNPMEPDTKVAYTISGEVDAYTGFSNNAVFIPIIDNQTEIISFSNAAIILDAYLGGQMEISVSTVGLEYVVIGDDSTQTQKVCPCWLFEGFNSSDGRYYKFCVNVIDGSVAFYSYTG